MKDKEPIELPCLLCKRIVKARKAFDFSKPHPTQCYLLLWDNISATDIGKEETIPYPTLVFCYKHTKSVQDMFKKIKKAAQKKVK